MAETLEQRGLLACEHGALAEALKMYQESLRIRISALGQTNVLVAQSRFNIADVLAQQGQLASALAESENSLKILQALGRSDYPLMFMAAFVNANILHRAGEWDKAAAFYKTALDGFEKHHLRHAAIAARDPGLLELDRGNPQKAVQFAVRALTIEESLWKDILRFGSEEDRLAWHGLSDILPLLATVAAYDPAPLSKAVLHLKSAVLDSLIEERQLGQIASAPEVTALCQARLRRYRAELNTTTIAPSAPGEIRRAADEVDGLESKLARRVTAMKENRRIFAATPESIQSNLPPATVLVEYVCYPHWLGKGRAEPRFAALIYQKDLMPRWIPLGPVDGPDGGGSLAEELQAMMHASVLPNSDTVVSNLLRLHDAIWAKVQPAIPHGTQWIIVAPDGELNFVPFAALWRQDHFLGQDYYFRYVTSGRDVLTPAYQTPTRREVDIWAAPEFARSTWKRNIDSTFDTLKAWWSVPAVRGGGPAHLPLSYEQQAGTHLEAESVARLAHANQCSPVQMFIGSDAHEKRIRAITAPYVLHFATHATFLPDVVIPSTPGLDSVFCRSNISLNPMARSWIALAQANETLAAWRCGELPDPIDDGLLTGEEVATLNLQGTWLTTLSACDTGFGKSRSGEGVFGLRRAFALAGARHLLVTLWPVSDERSRQFMEAFYADALLSNDAPGALARVQREKLAAWNNTNGVVQALRWAGPYVLNSNGL